MVTFVPEFVSSDRAAWSAAFEEHLRDEGVAATDGEALKAARTHYASRHPRPAVTLHQVADHVEHAREIAGVEGVGIGGDYDGCDALPDGLQDVSTYPSLFAALLDRGWSERELGKLAGTNVLRVMREAQSVSAELNERPQSLARMEDLDGSPLP